MCVYPIFQKIALPDPVHTLLTTVYPIWTDLIPNSSSHIFLFQQVGQGIFLAYRVRIRKLEGVICWVLWRTAVRRRHFWEVRWRRWGACGLTDPGLQSFGGSAPMLTALLVLVALTHLFFWVLVTWVNNSGKKKLIWFIILSHHCGENMADYGSLSQGSQERKWEGGEREGRRGREGGGGGREKERC